MIPEAFKFEEKELSSSWRDPADFYESGIVESPLCLKPPSMDDHTCRRYDVAVFKVKTNMFRDFPL
jgi:hypothetical protein